MNLTSREHVIKAALPLFDLPDCNRAQVCILALRQCADETGKTPTAREYEAWRKRQPDPDHLPKRSYVAHTFETWSAALAWIDGGFAPDIRWNGNGGCGVAYTRQDVAAAINEWLQELVVIETRGGIAPSHPDFRFRTAIGAIPRLSPRWFLNWTRSRTDGKLRVSSCDPIERLYGGWPNALNAARKLGGLKPEIDFLIRVSAMPREKRSKLALGLLGEATKEMRHEITIVKFDAWRNETWRSLVGEDQLVARTFGGLRIKEMHRDWRHAVSLATGRDLSEIRVRGATRTEDEVALSALRRVAKEIGHPPNYSEYEAERLEINDGLPVGRTVARVFGSWQDALAVAFGESGR